MKFFQKPKFLVPALLLLVLLIAGSIAGYALGRYRTELVMTGSVTGRTQLAEGFRLTAVRSDGRTADSETLGEEAFLIPGTGLNLRLSVEGKTEIPACLYVEVTGALDETALTDAWRRLEGVSGKHGGAVYAYRTVLDGTEPELELPLLRSPLTASPADSQAEPLSFCGYLLQITTEADRAEDQARTTFVNKFPQD